VASEGGQDKPKREHEGYKVPTGSYQRYYNYRHSGTESSSLDRRLIAVLKDRGDNFFEGKEVLDIGQRWSCFAGRGSGAEGSTRCGYGSQ